MVDEAHVGRITGDGVRALYRCKVRKPDGQVVDGCGHEFTPKTPERYSRDGMQCGMCKVGFMRAATSQIHGGPLVLEALGRTVASDADKADRQEVLRSAHNRLSALRMGTAMGRESDDSTIRETIALLKSLLPADPAADTQAQVDMAEQHNASADFVTCRKVLQVYGGPHAVRALERLTNPARFVAPLAALERIAGLVGAVEGAQPSEIADCVASALQEVTP